VEKLREAMDLLPDKLIGQLVATLPQFQPYHPFQPRSFHSTFPQPYQQPAPYLMSNALAAADKVESEESKVATLDIKRKTIWDTLVQMDPNPSMVQYHKSFKKGLLGLVGISSEAQHCQGYSQLQQYIEQLDQEPNH
jgi:hypothetical protein